MHKLLMVSVLFFVFSSSWAQSTLNMQTLGSYDSTTDEWSDIWGYVDEEGNEYAISGTEDSIYIIDVTDCSNPEVVFEYDGNSPIWRDFKTYGDYAYSVCDVGSCNEGLRIYDLTALPNGPITFAGQFNTWFDQAHNIYVDEDAGRLYACDLSGPSNDLVILDLTADPANPTLLYQGNLGGGYLHDLNVKDGLLYGSFISADEFRVYDVSDPNNITLVEELGGLDGAHASWNDATGEYAYLAEEKANHEINVIDLANLANTNNDIEVVNQIWDPLESDNGLIPHNVFVQNDFLYISHYEDGVKVYDITDRVNPVVAAYNDIYPDNGNFYNGFNGTWGVYPFLPSGCILASDIKYGVVTMQLDYTISDTCTPVIELTSSVSDGLYSASNYLTSNVLTDLTAPTIYQSEGGIDLLPGFETRGTASFDAVIAPCVPNN